MKKHLWLNQDLMGKRQDDLGIIPIHFFRVGIPEDKLKERARLMEDVGPKDIRITIAILDGAYNSLEEALNDNDSLAEYIEEHLAYELIEFSLAMIYSLNPALFDLK